VEVAGMDGARRMSATYKSKPNAELRRRALICAFSKISTKIFVED
jgi:hypothetical protein